MTSVPPPGLPHRPELPEGIAPPPGPPPRMVETTSGRPGWPAFQWWAAILAGFTAVFIAAVAFAVIGGLAGVAGADVDFDDPPPGITIGATLVQNAALIACAVLFATLGGNRPRRRDFGLRRTRVGPAVGWALLTMFAFYLFTIVYGLVLDVSEQDDLAQDLGADESTLNLIGVALLVTVAAPLGEEFFFRGFVYTALGRRVGPWLGALLTGVVFGAIHAGGTAAVFLVPLAVFGALLCVLMKVTGSILPCMALHAVNNAVALGVTLDWPAWQLLLTVVAAPLVVLAIAVPLSERAPKPAYA